MILIVYGLLALISLVMITIGLSRPSESSQALVGFLFLFLLGVVLINGSLEYQVGENINTSYTYVNSSSSQINNTVEYRSDIYKNFDDTTSHRFGYYLALASAVGFIGVIIGLKKSTEEED